MKKRSCGVNREGVLEMLSTLRPFNYNVSHKNCYLHIRCLQRIKPMLYMETEHVNVKRQHCSRI